MYTMITHQTIGSAIIHCDSLFSYPSQNPINEISQSKQGHTTLTLNWPSYYCARLMPLSMLDNTIKTEWESFPLWGQNAASIFTSTWNCSTEDQKRSNPLVGSTEHHWHGVRLQRAVPGQLLSKVISRHPRPSCPLVLDQQWVEWPCLLISHGSWSMKVLKTWAEDGIWGPRDP
jgi:hypothetical protein